MKKAFYLFFLLLMCWTGSCQYTKAVHQKIRGALPSGDKKCLECHKKWYSNIKRSPHIKLFSEENACEKCHGNGSLHVASPKNPKLIFTFKKLDYSTSAQICLECHQEDRLKRYMDLRHYKEGISCTRCHRVHKNGSKKLLIKSEPTLCFVCHTMVKVSYSKEYAHDVYSPRILCKGCHGGHNSLEIQVKKGNVREQCLTCHESIDEAVSIPHEPVTNSCTGCHAYHGSKHKNILRLGMPDLCTSCHKMDNHRVPIAENLPMGPQGTSTCTGCHVKIHGGEINNLFERMGPPILIEKDFIVKPDLQNIPANAPILNIPDSPIKKGDKIAEEDDEELLLGNDDNF